MKIFNCSPLAPPLSYATDHSENGVCSVEMKTFLPFYDIGKKAKNKVA